MIALRSMASDIAWRTRTSLNGLPSVRIERWLITAEGYSTLFRLGRFCLSVSLICTQSVRLIVPGNSQPRSYLPLRKAAMREALSSSTVISMRSMYGRPARKYPGWRTNDSPTLGR